MKGSYPTPSIRVSVAKDIPLRVMMHCERRNDSLFLLNTLGSCSRICQSPYENIFNIFSSHWLSMVYFRSAGCNPGTRVLHVSYIIYNDDTAGVLRDVSGSADS